MDCFAVQPQLPFDEFVAVEDDNRRLVWVLGALPDELLLFYLHMVRGTHRNEYPVEMMWRCVVAKYVYQIKTYAELVRELWRNPSLRRIVGCHGSVPQDYHFSRFLKRLSCDANCRRLVREMFDRLVERLAAVLPEFGRYLAVDGTAVRAYSNERRAKRGEGSDPDARWGTRTTRERTPETGEVKEEAKHWFGYVVQLVVDCGTELPVGYDVRPANENETLALRPLLDEFRREHPKPAAATEAVMADRGYDSRENCAYVLREMEALAIIKMRRRLKGDEIDQSALCCCTELGTPICPSGHKMVHWGRDGQYIKWRCPAKVGRERKVCTFRGGCGTASEYGRVLKVRIWEDPRRWPGVWRESRTFTQLYSKRTAAERVNSRLKEHLLLDDLTIRGQAKVELHTGLGLLVMLAGAWAMVRAGLPGCMRRTVRLAA
jgi:transposase